MKKYLFLTVLIFLTPCTTPAQLDIPYYKQTGPSCTQSQMLMTIKYFYPDKQITLEDLDKRTGRQPKQWTWFSQAMPVLAEERLDAHYYSLTPYQKLTPEFINKYYGDDGPLINSVTNWESLRNSIEFLKTSNRYQHKKLDWAEIEKAFQNKNVILMIIDYKVLINTPGPCAGHGVTITNIDKTHVTFHNSALGPNQVAEKEQFIKAWNAPCADNDVIIIKGRL